MSVVLEPSPSAPSPAQAGAAASRAVRPTLGPSARAALDGLRRGIHRYVIVEGAAAALAVFVIAGALTLLIDRSFELSREARLAWTEALVAATGGVLGWRLFRRLATPLTDRALAARLEKQFPQLRDSLSSAVHFSSADRLPDDCSPKLLARTCELAEQRTAALDLAEAFNPWPRTAAVGLAAALLVAAAIFGLKRPELVSVWAQRQFLLRNVAWPRDTHLAIDGFQNGAIKVARGDDLTLVVRAATAGVVPDKVQLAYRTSQGVRGRANMVRDGQADPQRDDAQRFTHVFPALLSDLEFDVRGGDGRLLGLRVEVVEPPALVSTTLRCEFPGYLNRPAQDIEARGNVDVPRGTRVEIVAQANKPLERIEAEELAAGAASRTVLAPEPGGLTFRYERGQVLEDQTLQFKLYDTDGIANQRPIRLVVAAVADAKPTLNVRPRGVGSSVTARARIPLSGKVQDDHRVARVWRTLVKQETGETIVEEDFALAEAAVRETAEVEATLALAPLQLAVGQKLGLTIKAADLCDLDGPAQIGVGEVFHLEVVTPEALTALLENRELNLRRRFETILSEVEQTSDELTALASKQADAAAEEGSPPAAAKPPAEEKPPAEKANEPSAELVALRAWQNSRKNADETLGVWQAFQLLLDEYSLNEIANPQRMSRLQGGILTPLKGLTEEAFPQFVAQLDALHKQVAAAERQPTADAGQTLAAAQRQCQTVSQEMHRILEQMLELETFNEAVDKLRSIIAAQERLNRQTEAERKQQGKRALRDE